METFVSGDLYEYVGVNTSPKTRDVSGVFVGFTDTFNYYFYLLVPILHDGWGW